MEIFGELRFGVDKGMSGWFALIYDNGGPIETGIGRYDTWEEAMEEAIEWAESENMNREAERLHTEFMNKI